MNRPTIFGLDFTSAPRKRKPITLAAGVIKDATLHIERLSTLTNFGEFEAWLTSEGPWIAALDFPFGQPRQLITDLGWPLDWTGYVGHVALIGQQGFEAAINQYREGRPEGQRYLLRQTDCHVQALSPMMLHRVPVGKMFFQGALRLLASDVSVLPCRPTSDERIALEGYPAHLARSLVGRQSYKTDDRHKQTEKQCNARQHIITSLNSGKLQTLYALDIHIPDELTTRLIEDASGDLLDAVLCAYEAAWASTQYERGYGIPEDCDALEGWIVDPVR